VLQLERLNGVGCAAADHVELALERVGDHDVRAATDEDLADHRLLGPHGGRHRHGVVGRHIAPAENDLAFGTYGTLDFFLTGEARGVTPSAGRPCPRRSHRLAAAHALLGHLLAKERIRNLDQDPGAVAHQRVGTDRAPVIQVLQDQQALLDDRVTFLAPDMRYKTDATGVVLVGRVVKPLPFRYGRIHHARILTKQRCMVPGRALRRIPHKNRHETG
jgi:hypothetical protein